MATSAGIGPQPGQPILLQGGTVLCMDQDRRILQGGDVLVRGERIEAVGQGLAAPADAFVVDARGSIVLPGMIDTHRHLWQTLMRGYGADWTLTQYFVWYYLEWGKAFRPEEVFAGNLLGGLEAIDAGVTTTVDWSHGLQSVAHAEAALAALDEAPGRYVLAYGNIQQGPWEWATSPDVQQFLRRLLGRPGGKVVPQLAFDVPGNPAFPERAAFEVARELGIRVTTHAGVWGATNDEGIRLMFEHGFMTPGTTYVHAATLEPDSYHRIAATGGTVSVATESEESAGQGYPTTYRLRQYGIPGSLSNDTSVWWSGDLFSAMRATLGADRAMEHLGHHQRGETLTHCSLRAEHVVAMATIEGARALGLDAETGSLEPGKAADVVLVRNPRSPAMLPILNPYGHLAFQAQRADVELVLAKGRVVKWAGELVDVDWARLRRLVEEGVDHLERTLGAEAWREGMHPEIPTTRVLENPYTYTYEQQDPAGEG